MAYVDDLFGDDNLLGDPNDLDNLVEYRDAGNNSDVDAEDRAGSDAEQKGDEDDENDGEKKEKKPEEVKIKRVKRPQPRLNPERLKGPRGLGQLKQSFADLKFQGKGHEPEDLQRIMSRLEHWSHRLFPKLQFDDFLEKVEKLGSKKVIQNYVKRLRMGLEDDDGVVKSDHEEAVDDPDPIANDTMGEFDRLLAEQVSLHDSRAAATPKTPAVAPVRTPMTARPGAPVVSSTPSALTAEQRARMEANRLAAIEKRRNRAAAAAAAAAMAKQDVERSEKPAGEDAQTPPPPPPPPPAQDITPSPSPSPASPGEASSPTPAASPAPATPCASASPGSPSTPSSAGAGSGRPPRSPPSPPPHSPHSPRSPPPSSLPSDEDEGALDANRNVDRSARNVAESSSEDESNAKPKAAKENGSSDLSGAAKRKKEDESAESTSKQSGGSSSDEEERKSSSGSSRASSGDKRSSSDSDEIAKKAKLATKDEDPPTPDESSWGLRSFLEKTSKKSNCGDKVDAVESDEEMANPDKD